MEFEAGTFSATEFVAQKLRGHHSEFEAFVRARVQPDDVDDVLQVAAQRAIERAESLHDPEAVMKWLYRIHRNLVTDVHRKRATERKYIDNSAILPEVSQPILDESCECSVSQARRLRSSYSSILTLVDTEGLELGEAALRLQLTKNNAAVRLHRARKALKDAMLEHCGVAAPEDCASCRCVEDSCCLT